MSDADDLVRDTVRRLLRDYQQGHPGLSDSAFARALGHQPPWISMFLSGQRNIQISNIDAIAAFFGLTPTQFFHEVGREACAAAAAMNGGRAADQAQARAYRATLRAVADTLRLASSQITSAVERHPPKRKTRRGGR